MSENVNSGMKLYRVKPLTNLDEKFDLESQPKKKAPAPFMNSISQRELFLLLFGGFV